jgi:hypothetical protein
MPPGDGMVFDDGHDDGPLVDPDDVTVDDLFSAGDRAALHVTVRGRYRGGLPGRGEHRNAPATVHAGALVTVTDGRVAGGRVIRDRLGLSRALTASVPASS